MRLSHTDLSCRPNCFQQHSMLVCQHPPIVKEDFPSLKMPAVYKIVFHWKVQMAQECQILEFWTGLWKRGINSDLCVLNAWLHLLTHLRKKMCTNLAHTHKTKQNCHLIELLWGWTFVVEINCIHGFSFLFQVHHATKSLFPIFQGLLPRH